MIFFTIRLVLASEMCGGLNVKKANSIQHAGQFAIFILQFAIICNLQSSLFGLQY